MLHNHNLTGNEMHPLFDLNVVMSENDPSQTAGTHDEQSTQRLVLAVFDRFATGDLH